MNTKKNTAIWVIAAVVIIAAIAAAVWLITGDSEKLEAIVNILKEFRILEIARTGVVAIERGTATINDESKERGEFNYGKNVL